MLHDMSLNRDYERRTQRSEMIHPTGKEMWDALAEATSRFYSTPETDKIVADIMKASADLAIGGKEGDGSMKTFGEWVSYTVFDESSPLSESFRPFPKVPRLLRDVTITEKIDGTNASVRVYPDGTVRAGSRTRWITPEDDNFGFAAWVRDHAEELRGLGEGHHFGEWWGRGIQRGYGLNERRFSLFNVSRWNADTPPPACCHIVPVLYKDLPFDALHGALECLFPSGSSYAAPGFSRPEGVMVYHSAARQYFKYTFDGDGHKGGARG